MARTAGSLTRPGNPPSRFFRMAIRPTGYLNNSYTAGAYEREGKGQHLAGG
jgi:hypothetical protein